MSQTSNLNLSDIPGIKILVVHRSKYMEDGATVIERLKFEEGIRTEISKKTNIPVESISIFYGGE